MAPGPVPAREDDLARPRSRNGRDDVPVTRGEMRPVRIPHPDPTWHEIALQLYKGQRSSGQADFMQNSDWAMLWSLCEDLSVYKKSGKRSAQMLQTIYSSMERLLVTEGDRRRVRIELHEKPDDSKPAELYAIESYRAELDES